MRILVLLDPTNRRGTKTAYTNLRNFLRDDGYQRIGVELYMRIATNRKGAEKHIRRLQAYAPKTGVVRILKLTEKQYAGIQYLTGGPDMQEEIVGNKAHITL